MLHFQLMLLWRWLWAHFSIPATNPGEICPPVWTVLLPTAVAKVVWKREHAEAVQDPISVRAQGLTCIKPVLEQRPCKTPMKTTNTRLFNFIHLSRLLKQKELHRLKITIYTHDLLVQDHTGAGNLIMYSYLTQTFRKSDTFWSRLYFLE